MVLYEILIGRRAVEKNWTKPEQKLLDWVKKFPPESTRFSEIMDTRLRNEYPLSAARLVAKLANTCLSKNPKDRPGMWEVLGALDQAIEVSREEGYSLE